MALLISGFVSFSAEAQVQENNQCGIISTGRVCKSTGSRGAYCYKTRYSENYKVCKGGDNDPFSYFICCQVPDKNNTTFAEPINYDAMGNNEDESANTTYYKFEKHGNTSEGNCNCYENWTKASLNASRVAPQSQSYPPDYVVKAGIAFSSCDLTSL